MPRIFLVRHGHAAASFTDDLDPGLDETGTAQAQAVAPDLAKNAPLKLISSPLKRAQETALPLQALLGGEISLEQRVSEIPSPGLSLDERGSWLRGVMSGVWRDQSDELKVWRDELVNCLISQQTDCAIFSHFVAINVAVGFAEKDDRLTLFRPANASVTIFETDGESLILKSRGSEAETKVN
jgi:broad specificity phosphatase PhoE